MNIKHKVTIQKLLSVNLSKCRVVWTQKILLNAQDVTFIVALFGTYFSMMHSLIKKDLTVLTKF